MQHLKVKLILIAFCLCAVAGSQLYLKGFYDGIASIDQEAFDSYAHFAKPFQSAVKHDAASGHSTKHQTQTVWAAIDGRRE